METGKIKKGLCNTLEQLKEDEFKDFKGYLARDDILKGFKGIPVFQLEKADRQDTVDLMVQKYQGPGALKLTMKVLEMIGRKDLMQDLQHLPSGPKGSDTSSKEAKISLFNILNDLKCDEFKNFKWYLEEEKVGGIPPIKESQLLKADRRDTVDLMVQQYEPDGAVRVTKNILERMDKNDLVRELPNISSGAGDIFLLRILQELKKNEFEVFNWHLTREKVGDIPPIKKRQLSGAERQDVVDLMVQKYEFAGAVEVMKSILKNINRNDLVRELLNISSGAEDTSSKEGAVKQSDHTMKIAGAAGAAGFGVGAGLSIIIVIIYFSKQKKRKTKGVKSGRKSAGTESESEEKEENSALQTDAMEEVVVISVRV